MQSAQSSPPPTGLPETRPGVCFWKNSSDSTVGSEAESPVSKRPRLFLEPRQSQDPRQHFPATQEKTPALALLLGRELPGLPGAEGVKLSRMQMRPELAATCVAREGRKASADRSLQSCARSPSTGTASGSTAAWLSGGERLPIRCPARSRRRDCKQEKKDRGQFLKKHAGRCWASLTESSFGDFCY